MNCQGCGQENPRDSVFCEDCGVKLGRVCEACGTPNASAARFCRKCGASLVEARPDLTPGRDLDTARTTEPRAVLVESAARGTCRNQVRATVATEAPPVPVLGAAVGAVHDPILSPPD